MKNPVVIVANETDYNFHFLVSEKSYFIGVERGALDLIKKNIKLDAAIGDFDKVSANELQLIKKNAQFFECHNRGKDYLDGELAVLHAKKLDYSQIYFIAKPTDRYDKNFSIFDLVWKYDLQFQNSQTRMFLLKTGQNVISRKKFPTFHYVSFFAKEKTLITINNMKYNINNLELLPWENKCISNAFLEEQDPLIICDKAIVCVISK